MYLLHLNWNLEYSCTGTKQTHFHRRFQIISLNIAKSITRHVNATKSYLHFDRFAGEAILCSNFFCFLLFLDVLFLS